MAVKFTLGIAPIGWRNDDIPSIGADNDLDKVLGEASGAGFKGIEIGGFFPGPEELNRKLRQYNIKAISQWFSSFIIRDGIEKACAAFEKHCQYLHDVGAHVAVVSEQTYSIQGSDKACIFTEKPKFTDDEWKKLCEGLNRYGRIAKVYDVKVAYHHHMGTGVQTYEETSRLLDNTDPKLVNIVYDTGHIYVSDGDYLKLLHNYIDRIVHVHFKDVRKKEEKICRDDHKTFMNSFLTGMFTVPGDGDLDFAPVMETLIKNKYDGWIVVEAEQDPDKHNPKEMAEKAYNYIQSLVKKFG